MNAKHNSRHIGRAVGAGRWRAWLRRPRPAMRRWVAGVAAFAVLATLAVVAVRWITGPDTYLVHADFAETPGVYEGNQVKILGVKVGRITKIDAGRDGVEVTMEIDAEQRLPKDVTAYLMAPNAVNDRFIEFAPAYSGSGPQLEAGAEIGRERTILPSSVDQIIDNVHDLSEALGPDGANANGSLSQMVHVLAEALGGNGTTLNELVGSLGTTVDAVADDADALTSGLTDLGELSTAAGKASDSYVTFARRLSKVSSNLSADAPQIAKVLTNLQQMLIQLNGFVDDNKEQLGNTITDLSGVIGEVGDNQKALDRLLRTAPLAVDNLGKTIVPTADGPAVQARLNPVDRAKVGRQVCGDGLLRLMLVALEETPSKREVLDLACGLDRWLNDEVPKPKGAPDASAWTREALAGLGG